jgi:hypothetical protein
MHAGDFVARRTFISPQTERIIMIRRRFQRRLEFESLESMELLSGAGLISAQAMAHHHTAHQASRAPTPGETLAPSGIVHGRYHVIGGMMAAFSGRGTLMQVGKTQLRGTIEAATIQSASSGGGQFTLSFGRRGKLLADVTSATSAGAHTYQIVYQIAGGTRSFAGDTGGGVATVRLSGLQPRGHFTLSLQG